MKYGTFYYSNSESISFPFDIHVNCARQSPLPPSHVWGWSHLTLSHSENNIKPSAVTESHIFLKLDKTSGLVGDVSDQWK